MANIKPPKTKTPKVTAGKAVVNKKPLRAKTNSVGPKPGKGTMAPAARVRESGYYDLTGGKPTKLTSPIRTLP